MFEKDLGSLWRWSGTISCPNFENMLITSQGLRLVINNVKNQAENTPNSTKKEKKGKKKKYNQMKFSGFYKKSIVLDRSNNRGIHKTHEWIPSTQNIFTWMWDQKHRSLCEISSNVELTKWRLWKIFLTLFYTILSRIITYHCFKHSHLGTLESLEIVTFIESFYLK